MIRSFRFISYFAGCLWLTVAPACGSESDRPKVPDPGQGARTGGGGEADADGGTAPSAQGGAGSNGESGESGTANVSFAGEGGQADSSGGRLMTLPAKPLPAFPFDPNNVYLKGEVVGDAIAAVTEPNTYAIGGDDLGGTQILGDQLLYIGFSDLSPALGVRVFEPDYVGSLPARDLTAPPDPHGNDPVYDTPACPAAAPYVGPRAFLVSPDQRLIYQCPDFAWYEGEEVVFAANDDIELLRLGNNGVAWVEELADQGTMKLSDGVPHTQPSFAEVMTVRAHDDGFRYVTQPGQGDDRPELWFMDAAGNAGKLGTYPLPPNDVYAGTSNEYDAVLTPDGALWQIAGNGVGIDYVLRRTLEEEGGVSEVVFDSEDKPRISSPRGLLTGR